MDLITLVIYLVIVGVILWAINKYIPMEPTMKNIVNGLVIIVVILWLVSMFVPGLPSIHVGR